MDFSNFLRLLNLLLILVVLSIDTASTRAPGNAVEPDDVYIEFIRPSVPPGYAERAGALGLTLDDVREEPLSEEQVHPSGDLDMVSKRGWEQIDRYWRRPPKRAWELIDQLWDRRKIQPWKGDRSIWGMGKRQKEELFTIPLPTKKNIAGRDSRFQEIERSNSRLDMLPSHRQNGELGTLRSSLLLPEEKSFPLRLAKEYTAALEEILKRLLTERGLRRNSTGSHLVGTGAKDYPQFDNENGKEGNEKTFGYVIDMSRDQKRGWDETDGLWHCHCCKRDASSRCCNACRYLLTYHDDTDTQYFELLRSSVCRCCKSNLNKAERCCALCNVLN